MKSFFLMLSFFTRLPVPRTEYEEETYQNGIKCVPVIGLLIGVILWGTALLAGSLYLLNWMSVLLIVVYIILTGGLHLDGLADTCDGLFSGREKDGMLLIMKDSRIGTFGVLSLLIWFEVFRVTLNQFWLGTLGYEWLILVPVMGRSAQIVSAHIAPYARQDGMGKIFVDGSRGKELAWALGIPIVLTAWFTFRLWQATDEVRGYTGPPVPVMLAAGAVLLLGLTFGFAIHMTRAIEKKLGGVTGDTLGCVCEVSQIVFLLILVLLDMLLAHQLYGSEMNWSLMP